MVFGFKYIPCSTTYANGYYLTWPEYTFEGLFLIYIIVQFFKYEEQEDFDTPKSKRELSVTASHYLNGMFIWELIPLIPFQMWKLDKNHGMLFYSIKVVRLLWGFQLFDV